MATCIALSFAIDGTGTSQSAIPPLDGTRVYLLGCSAGALTALHTAALDDRIAGTACFAGWTSMREGDNRRLWELHALAPRLGLFAGLDARAALSLEASFSEE